MTARRWQLGFKAVRIVDGKYYSAYSAGHTDEDMGRHAYITGPAVVEYSLTAAAGRPKGAGPLTVFATRSAAYEWAGWHLGNGPAAGWSHAGSNIGRTRGTVFTAAFLPTRIKHDRWQLWAPGRAATFPGKCLPHGTCLADKVRIFEDDTAAYAFIHQQNAA